MAAETSNKEQKKSTLTDKLAREKDRKEIGDWRKIYLYREGTFFRAFGASAWLLATYVYSDDFRKQIGGKQPLQVQHALSKTNGDYIFAGFPIASIDKYVTMCELQTDGDEVVALMHECISPLFQTVGECEEAYERFVASLPPAKEKKEKPRQQAFPSQDEGGSMAVSGGLFDIFRAILAYPLEEKTPLDTVDEFRRLKKMALRLF